MELFVLIFYVAHLVLHFLLGLVYLHARDRLKLIFLPIKFCCQLPPDSCIVQCAHLIFLVLAFQRIIQLFDVLIQSVRIGLHLLDDELKLLVLPFTLVNLPK